MAATVGALALAASILATGGGDGGCPGGEGGGGGGDGGVGDASPATSPFGRGTVESRPISR